MSISTMVDGSCILHTTPNDEFCLPVHLLLERNSASIIKLLEAQHENKSYGQKTKDPKSNAPTVIGMQVLL